MLCKIRPRFFQGNSLRFKQRVNCNRTGNHYQSARHIHNVNYDEVYENTKSLFQCKKQNKLNLIDALAHEKFDLKLNFPIIHIVLCAFAAKKLPKDVNKSAVFACNELDLNEIHVYGFDYDYTLACYKPLLNDLLYNLGRDTLIEKFKVKIEMIRDAFSAYSFVLLL